MYLYLIKYFFIFSTAFYLYAKLLNINIEFFRFKSLISIIVLSFTTSNFSQNMGLLSIIFPYTLFYLVISITFYTAPQIGFVTSIIAFCLSHGFLVISSTFCGIFFFLLSPKAHYFSDIFSTICCGLFAYFISHIPFKIKKYENGMKYLYNSHFINAGSVIGFFTIAALTIAQQMSISNTLALLLPYYVLIAVIILFLIWQRQIKRYYNSKLRKLELESLRQELEEKNATIRKLSDDNDSLARIIHKDNKLIPAMLTAVTEYLDPENMRTDTEREAQGKALADQLKELAKDRMGILGESTHTDRTLPLTGHAAVDAMLSYMKKRADMAGIRYEVKLHPDFASRIGPEISEADLSHLLSDLIENAIIATNSAEHKSLLVHLGILYDTPTVEVSDSGIPFAPEVYQDFGLQKHSTHLGEGGSGIGLMDIWELKKKYAASLHIYEYPPERAPFTKKLSMVFDHKKHYLIRSYRPEEIVKLQARSDLYILPLQEDTH